MGHEYHETLCKIVEKNTKILLTLTQTMAEKSDFRYFLSFVRDDYNFCFEYILLRLKIVYALKCLHRQTSNEDASIPGTSIPVQSVILNCVNCDKVFQISL